MTDDDSENVIDDDSENAIDDDSENATDDRFSGERRSDGAPEVPPDAASPEKVERIAAEFEAEGRPYARVTVVRRDSPVSANVGDRALVTPDGELIGWIGGAECAQSVVLKEATAALESGEPVLVGLAPDPDEIDRPGLEAYPMTCHSGGTLELFVEPVTPVSRLVVVGESPIARALVRLADQLTFDVTVVTDTDDGGEVLDVAGADETVPLADVETVAAAIEGADYVVVASVGEYDELGVAAGLLAGASYVGLVASEPRRDELAGAVAEHLDLDQEIVIDAVTTAAGLDIGARTAEEIAVSVLAELVGVRRGVEGSIPFEAADATVVSEHIADIEVDVTAASSEDDATAASDEGADAPAAKDESDGEVAVDPVCGMDVVVAEAAATAEHDGATYHFCGQGCADAFEDDPGRYLDEVTVDG